MMKTAVVTGATSFTGGAVIKKLKLEGYEVTAFRHSYTKGAVFPREPNVWLHFAWAGPGSEHRKDPAIQKFNLSMSLEALKKAALLGCRKFIFAGSQAEYGHAQDGSRKKEDGIVAPESEYGKAKLTFGREASRMLKSACLDMQYIHMRIFSAYGPGDHGDSLLFSLKNKLLLGEDVLLGPCRQMWDYIYIDDLAEAIYLLCEKGKPGTYNVGSGDIRPLREYVELAGRIILGDEADKHLHFDMREDNAEGDADLCPDISRIKALGFEPKVSFEEGIQKLKSYYLDNNYAS